MEGSRMCQLTRMKPITTSVRLRRRRGGDQGDNQVRHSADMDYGPPRRSQIRRNINNNNNSVEWEDEGFTTEPVKRRNKVTNFHNMSMTRPSMQTLDRRISVSSDQLDTMKAGEGTSYHDRLGRQGGERLIVVKSYDREMTDGFKKLDGFREKRPSRTRSSSRWVDMGTGTTKMRQ